MRVLGILQRNLSLCGFPLCEVCVKVFFFDLDIPQSKERFWFWVNVVEEWLLIFPKWTNAVQTFTKMPRSNMASVNIVTAWIVMCLVLFGAALRKDPNAKACAFAKPCICFGTKVDCKNRSLRMIPEGIPRNTIHLWVVIAFWSCVCVVISYCFRFWLFKVLKVP